MITRHLIAAPTEEVITLAEAKSVLGISESTYDAQIQAIINACVAVLDPSGQGWLGRALRPQTWEIRADSFADAVDCRDTVNRIWLPYPPLIDLVSVTYKDGDGVDQVLLEDTGYRVIGGGNGKSYVAPVYNGYWPSHVRNDYETLRIRYECGYPDDSPDPLPPQIKQSVLLAARDLYSLGERNLYLRSEDVPGLGSFEWTVSENAGTVIRSAYENLLSTVRVYE